MVSRPSGPILKGADHAKQRRGLWQSACVRGEGDLGAAVNKSGWGTRSDVKQNVLFSVDGDSMEVFFFAGGRVAMAGRRRSRKSRFQRPLDLVMSMARS